jgi:hypothetical protein
MRNPLRSERGFSVPGGMLAAAGVGAILAGSYLYSQGLIRVSVSEKRSGGDHLHLALPGALIPLALAFVPASEIGKHMPAEASQHLPLVEAAVDELQKLPDCTLVKVDGPEEQVRIQVSGGTMVIDVNDHGDEVHVTLPLGSLRSVMSKLESAAAYARTAGTDEGADAGKPCGHRGHPGGRHHDENHSASPDADADSATPAAGPDDSL